MIKKIIIVGEGGKGVKFMSNIFLRICSKLGYNISLVYKYDSNVRGGLIESKIVVSDKKITSPFFKEADFLIKLSKPKHKRHYYSKATIFDEGTIRNKAKHKKLLEVPFNEISEKLFNSKRHSNMVALGKLLRCIGIMKNEKDIDKIMPIKLDKKHIQAIKEGLKYKEILP